ncbi:MAG: GIY-YIG nuclease family protein [Patescibacteria group bacterium]
MISWHYVYILLSQKDAHFYIGSSDNVFHRVQQHNLGLNVSTAPRRPLTLIYYEAHRSKKDALRRENYFKTTKGKVTLRSIIRSFLKSTDNASPRVLPLACTRTK